MLDSLNSETWAFMMLGLVVCAGLYAWAADAVLGRFGFGVLLTTFIAEGGGYGSLMGIDWAITHQKLPYVYATPIAYVGGAMACVTVLLFVLCFLKQFIIR